LLSSPISDNWRRTFRFSFQADAIGDSEL
jgi:hypothetical protein